MASRVRIPAPPLVTPIAAKGVPQGRPCGFLPFDPRTPAERLPRVASVAKFMLLETTSHTEAPVNQTRSLLSAALIAATTLIAISACKGSSTGPSQEVVVRTAEAVYQVPPAPTHLAIEAAVTNAMNDVLLLDGLGRDFARLEKHVGGSWRLAYSPIYIMPLVPDIELPPGATRQLTIGLYVSAAPNTFPKFEYDVPGTYRAVFGFRVRGGKGIEVYSNEFELRAAE